ncbi:transposase family protein, partial [Lentzea tibetensis]
MKGKQIDLWYSGKAHEHGGNIQALPAPNGFPSRVGDVEPGSVHDLTAAHEHVLVRPVLGRLQLLPTLADSGYHGRVSACSRRSSSHRRPGPRRRQPHLQRPAARPAMLRRTRLRDADRTLARPATSRRLCARSFVRRRRIPLTVLESMLVEPNGARWVLERG